MNGYSSDEQAKTDEDSAAVGKGLCLLCAAILLTVLPLTALADSDARLTSYVIFGGADFAQLKPDSDHPYLYNSADGH